MSQATRHASAAYARFASGWAPDWRESRSVWTPLLPVTKGLVPHAGPPLRSTEVRAEPPAGPHLDPHLPAVACSPLQAPGQERFETGRRRAEERLKRRLPVNLRPDHQDGAPGAGHGKPRSAGGTEEELAALRAAGCRRVVERPDVPADLGGVRVHPHVSGEEHAQHRAEGIVRVVIGAITVRDPELRAHAEAEGASGEAEQAHVVADPNVGNEVRVLSGVDVRRCERIRADGPR